MFNSIKLSGVGDYIKTILSYLHFEIEKPR
jgi:hypothetical protein